MILTVVLEPPHTERKQKLSFVWLDLTRACQALCDMCYNDSGPKGTHGTMTREDWLSALSQVADLGARQVQFIGGEPTMHPNLAELINHALDLGLAVEVFSNLIHIRPGLWPVLRQRGVTMATSYFSDQAEQHDAITHHRGAYQRTKANIKTAVRYGIPLRAGIIDTRDGQHVQEAKAELIALGVTRIGSDKARGIGRGAAGHGSGTACNTPAQLCGRCAHGRAAILPSGEVSGCVMSGGMATAGNVRTTPLAAILASPEWNALAAAIPRPARPGPPHEGCGPAATDSCHPDPAQCAPGKAICVPSVACSPHARAADSAEASPTALVAACAPEDACEPYTIPVEVCGPSTCAPDSDGCIPHADSSLTAQPTTACIPDTPVCGPMLLCAPDSDGCHPHRNNTAVVTNAACVPDSCTPREDSCQPSPGVGERVPAYTATACRPDNDGSDCAPAETPACNPAY